MSELGYQVITDEEIKSLFEGTNFGEHINDSVELKRDELLKWTKNKRNECWVGHTAFTILVLSGLVKDNLPVKRCTPTGRGLNFIEQEKESNNE